MSTRIPLPGQMIDTLMGGLKTGSGLYANAMHPILEREKQKQLEQHFQEQLKLSKAAAGRNSQLFPFRLQELKDKHAAAEFERNMMNQLLGGGEPGAGAGGMAMPGGQQAPISQEMPTQESGQGMGMFTPEGMQQMQEAQAQAEAAPQAPQGGNNPLMNKLMQNPMMRGWFKHKFGYDPLAPVAQTPAEKQADALNLFKQKEEIKAANKSGNTATNKVLTQNQQAVQAIDTVLPMVDDFINHPNTIYGPTDFSPSKKAAYNAKTGGMIDLLVAAQSLPQVKESVSLVEDQIRRKTNEGTDAYIKRLKDFKKDLMARKQKAISVVNSKKVDTTSTAPNETKTIGGVKYEKINGEWHEAD